MTSIMELMEGMKRDADEIIGKGEKLIAKQNTDDTFESIHGDCENCGEPLEYEKGDIEHHDQPAFPGGYYCNECEEWK